MNDLLVLLGFEHWKYIDKGLPLWSVKDHPGSIDVKLDGSSPSSFGATSWSFPAMNVWVEVIPDRPFVPGGWWHAEEMSEPE